MRDKTLDGDGGYWWWRFLIFLVIEGLFVWIILFMLHRGASISSAGGSLMFIHVCS